MAWARVSLTALTLRYLPASAPRTARLVACGAAFPFRDNVDVLAAHGVTCIIQPGGSKRDDESIQACNEHNIAMVFTGARHFRH